MKDKKNKGPQHISKLIDNAKKEWAKSRAEYYFNSSEFNDLEDISRHAGLQVIFLYIEGDPEYIRTIFLN